MSIKQLFDMPANDSKKLPTLKQFLVKKGKAKLPKYFPIQIIWEPNQFPNWTLQTEYFKVRVSEDNPFYVPLRDVIKQGCNNDWLLAIEVSEDRDGKYSIIHIENETADWEGLGENGWKLVVQNKK